MERLIAIQGNKLCELNLKTDTSLFLASFMYRKKYRIFWYEPDDIEYSNETFLAKGCYIAPTYDSYDGLKYIKESEDIKVDLSRFDCIMIRQNPPVNMDYITATHLLSLLQEKHEKIFFMNEPSVLRNDIEKLLPINIAQNAIPPTMISNNINSLIRFLNQQHRIVLKPIYGYGGNDIIQVNLGEDERICEYLHLHSNLQIIAQKFLPEVYDGDKRVIVCDGEIIGVVGRMPQTDSFITNSRAGGIPFKTELSEGDRHLCERLAKNLKSRNIFFAGIDLIGSYVTEINITSPTLLIALYQQYGSEPIEKMCRKIHEKILERNFSMT